MQEALTAVIGLGDGTCDLQRGARSRARLNVPLGDFPSRSGVLSLILLNGFPMNLSS